MQEDAGWRDNLYRMYTTSSANMRVAVYGSKHDAANYEELLRKFCAVTELVSAGLQRAYRVMLKASRCMKACAVLRSACVERPQLGRDFACLQGNKAPL